MSAAEEPDPFASIRGDFDLSGSDSHQWKTSLKLPDAEKCELVKTPPTTSTSGTSLDIRLHVSRLRIRDLSTPAAPKR